MRLAPLAAALGALLLAGAPCLARDYYVRPDGSDAAPGTAATAAGAFRTLGRACAVAGPGDAVNVADGVYEEGEVSIVDKQGTPDRPLVLRAVNRRRAALRSTTAYHALRIVRCTGVVVDGLEISHKEPARHKFFGILVADSNWVTVRNCYLHDIGSSGIQANGGEHYVVEDNIVRHTCWATGSPNGSGISFYHPRHVADYREGEWGIVCHRNVVFDNYCPWPEFTPYPTDGNGIILDDFRNTQAHNKGGQEGGYRHPSLVENNLVFNNGGRGIHLFNTDNATVRRNTLYQNNHELSRHMPYGWNGDLNVHGENNRAQGNLVVFREGNPRGYAIHVSGKNNEVAGNVFSGPFRTEPGAVTAEIGAANKTIDAAAASLFVAPTTWKLTDYPDPARRLDHQIPLTAQVIDILEPGMERHFGLRPGGPAAGVGF